MEVNKKTPLEDLRKSALEDYEKASKAVHHYNSDIPIAIKFYFNHLKETEGKMTHEEFMKLNEDD